jgi:hypothetical protein
MLSTQTSIGQNQNSSWENDALPTPVVMVWKNPRCAWCLREQDLELGSGSHGICPKHADAVLQQYREHRMRRQLAP